MKWCCLQKALNSSNSFLVYNVPTSVGLEIYTILGCTICSSVCVSNAFCINSTVNLPSSQGIANTLCPVASIAPVSWTLIWPVSAAITAWYGFKQWEIVTKFVCVPPTKKCTSQSKQFNCFLMHSDAFWQCSSSP